MKYTVQLKASAGEFTGRDRLISYRSGLSSLLQWISDGGNRSSIFSYSAQHTHMRIKGGGVWKKGNGREREKDYREKVRDRLYQLWWCILNMRDKRLFCALFLFFSDTCDNCPECSLCSIRLFTTTTLESPCVVALLPWRQKKWKVLKSTVYFSCCFSSDQVSDKTFFRLLFSILRESCPWCTIFVICQRRFPFYMGRNGKDTRQCNGINNE